MANGTFLGTLSGVDGDFSGTVSVGGSISSPNYDAGVDGWTINADGTAELNDVVIRGTVYATAGEFSGTVTSGATIAASNFTAPTAQFESILLPAGTITVQSEGDTTNITGVSVTTTVVFADDVVTGKINGGDLSWGANDSGGTGKRVLLSDNI